MNTPKKSQLHFTDQLPSPQRLGKDSIVIYDDYFETHRKSKEGRLVWSWLQKFPNRYGVKSGEKLKSIEELPTHIAHIMPLCLGKSIADLKIISLGGGSVGDFSGFIASILKRGVGLVHIPTTWLSAIDSAHGGKTALNVGKVKNQVGTFYVADDIYLVKQVLLQQPQERFNESLGESLKMGLIEGGTLWKNLSTQNLNSRMVIRLLPQLISAKNKIVYKDPHELKGLRSVLNFGHTIGHVLESKLKMAHGEAVLYGVGFAIEWSLRRKILSSSHYYDIRFSEIGGLIPDRIRLRKVLREVRDPSRLLLQDKKVSSQQKIRFIFLKSPGHTVIESVALHEIVNEFRRQSY